MITLNLPDLLLLAITTTLVAAVTFFVNRWLKNEAKRRDAEKQQIQRYMVKTDAIVYAAIETMNGKGEEFEIAMMKKYDMLCKEKGLDK
jgi:hypothetical protein